MKIKLEFGTGRQEELKDLTDQQIIHIYDAVSAHMEARVMLKNHTPITTPQIQTFIDDRPALSASAFCREVGITKRYLDYILQGERPLTEETARKLKPVMIKYGWSEP